MRDVDPVVEGWILLGQAIVFFIAGIILLALGYNLMGAIGIVSSQFVTLLAMREFAKDRGGEWRPWKPARERRDTD
jgi:hypothetical protein